MRVLRVLLLFAVLLPSAPAARADRGGDLAFGWQLIRQGLFEPAQFSFAEYMENYGPDAEALYGMALALDGQGKHEEAVPRILEAEAGTNLPAHLRSPLARDAAGILERAGRSDEARVRYRRIAEGTAAALRPWGRFREGVVLLRMRRWEEAEEAFAMVVEHAPDDTLVPDARFNLGYARFRRGDLENAGDLLSAVESAHPRSPAAVDALALLARIFETRRECDGAIREVDKAISLASTLRMEGARLGELRYQRAYTLYQCGGVEGSSRATEAFRAVARDASNGIYARKAANFVGQALFEAGDLAGAKEAIAPYLEEEEASGLRLLAARIARAEGKNAEALARVRTILEDRTPEGDALRPEAAVLFADLEGKASPAEADAILAEAVAAAGEIPVRDRLIERWIRLRLEVEDFAGADSIARRLSGDAGEEIRIQWAEALQAAGRGEEAIAMLRALRPTPHFALGYVLYRMARYPEAATSFEAHLAAAGASRRAEAQYWLGWSRYQKDEYAKAEAAFAAAADAAREAGNVELARAARRNAGNAAYNIGAFDRAAEIYAHAASDEHGSARDEVVLLRGEALAEAGRIDQAVELFLWVAWNSTDTALAEDGLFRAASRLVVAGALPRAADLYDTFLVRTPASPRRDEALFLAARTWAAAGESTAARARYERLLAEGRGDYALEAGFRLGAILEAGGDLAGAMGYYDRAAAPGEDGRRASMVGRRAAIAAGRVRLMRGENAGAREIAESLAREIAPSQPLFADLCALDGEIFLRAGDTRAAIARFESAVALLPSSCLLGAQKYRLGWLYLSIDNPAKARRHLEFVYRADDMKECPERRPAGRLLVEVYERLRLTGLARRTREEVMQR